MTADLSRRSPEGYGHVATGELEPGVHISLLYVVNVILRHARLVAVTTIIIVALAIVWTATRDPEYTSVAVFQPEVSESGGSRLSGIAAQLGVPLSSSSPRESVEFYAELLQSRAMREKLARSTLSVSSDIGAMSQMTVATYLDTEGGSEAERIRRAVKRLDSSIAVGTNVATGLVTLRVSASDGEAAVQMNRTLLQLLNEFNLQSRQTQAAAEREFVSERLAEAEKELRQAESDLENFLQNNRVFAESPQLSFEAARLQRRVDLRQQVYTSLAQMLEQARIDEVRNTPVFTVIDPPEGSAEPSTRSLLLAAIVALVLGVMLAVGVAFVADHLIRHRRLETEEYREFRALSHGLLRRVLPRSSRRAAGELD